MWFQNARAKYRRNNAKAANQQLYDVNQQTSHMLQFQHQQQNYHHHHQHPHHHQAHTRPLCLTDQPIDTPGQQQHHHMSNQESPGAMGRPFVSLGASHQVAGGTINLIDQPAAQVATTIHNIKPESFD